MYEYKWEALSFGAGCSTGTKTYQYPKEIVKKGKISTRQFKTSTITTDS